MHIGVGRRNRGILSLIVILSAGGVLARTTLRARGDDVPLPSVLSVLDCPVGEDIQQVHADLAADDPGSSTPSEALQQGLSAFFPSIDWGVMKLIDSTSSAQRYSVSPAKVASPPFIVDIGRTAKGWRLSGITACDSAFGATTQGGSV